METPCLRNSGSFVDQRSVCIVCCHSNGGHILRSLERHYHLRGVPYSSFMLQSANVSELSVALTACTGIVLISHPSVSLSNNVLLQSVMQLAIFKAKQILPIASDENGDYQLPDTMPLLDSRKVNEYTKLENFLENHMVVKSSDEGYFAVLVDDVLRIIMHFIDDDVTFVRASHVNKRWQKYAIEAWYNSCKTRNLLDDEVWWREKAKKDWRWILRMKTCTISDVKKDGIGKVASASYKGDWSSEQKNGWGILTVNGTIYKGHFSNNVKNGWGVINFANGGVYEGCWVNDRKDGKGVYRWANGDLFDGEWQEDSKNGYGVYTFGIRKDLTAIKYDGNWKVDRKSGKGKFFWVNGDVYDGDWLNDLRHGYGVYKFGKGQWEGDVYDGEWRENKKWGIGKYVWTNGDFYHGHYHADQRSGNGIVTYSHGGRYEGSYKSDKREGTGTFYWKDGEYFVGEWKSGSRSGQGVLHKLDGQMIEQIWNEPPDANYATSEPSKYPANFVNVSARL